MAIQTHVDRARDRVAGELTRARDGQRAYRQFAERVADVSIEPTAASAGTTTVTTVGNRTDRTGSDEGPRAIRTAFARTVHGCQDGSDRSVQAALRREFLPAVAAALSSTSGAHATPAVRQAILETARKRLTKTRVLEQALEREADSLETVATTVSTVTDWFVAQNPTPLSNLDFGALRARHERLAAFRERCQDDVYDRQAHLQSTTCLDGMAGVRHGSLLESCYEDFPVDHPALATMVALGEACDTAQRSVRSHLGTWV